MRKPRPASDVDDVRAPSADSCDKRGISKSNKMVSTGLRCCVGNKFEIITIGQIDIPSNRLFETAILHRRCARMPGEKDFDDQIIAACQTFIQRHVILDWMGNNNSEPQSRATHSLVSTGGRFDLRYGRQRDSTSLESHKCVVDSARKCTSAITR